MAQAARLNLRMQKELKLLLTDPPPGASFPLLSADTDLFSLSTIDAQIEGPEGTVYASGIFNIRIQIPERYPFQPPSVTFATPIYHPNIDNGGRICLDILNLPPKGAWQPSLNISTVLTSIGLLLSEPNPDDGLMCEASREYKYNRQAFDQKARSITEKYAKGGAGGISFRSQFTQAHSNSSMMEFQRLGAQKQEVVNDPVSSSKKPYEVSQNLMLGSPVSDKRRGRDNGEEENVVFNYPLSDLQHQMAVKGKGKDLKEAIPEYNLCHKKQEVTKRNLSLNSSASCGKRERNKEKAVLHQSLVQSHNLNSLASCEASNGHEQQHHDDKNNLFTDGKRMSLAKLHQVNKQQSAGSLDPCQTVYGGNNEKTLDALQSSPSPYPAHFISSGGGLPAALSISHNELCPYDTTVVRTGSGSFNTEFPEICPVSKRLSLGCKSSSAGLENDDKENVMPILKLPTPNLQTSPKKSGNRRKLSLGPLTSLQGSDKSNIEQVSYSPNCLDTCNSLSMQHHCRFDGKEKPNLNNGKTDGGIRQQAIEESSSIPKELIVVDSEDSEAEDVRGASRFKLSLVRKRMGKRRAQA